MVRYLSDDGVFDAPLEKVWRLIEAHSDTNVGHIHAAFASQRTTEERPGVLVAEVQLRTPDGKLAPARMRLTPRPPVCSTVEFLDGPFAGSWATSTYVPEGARTRVVTVGEFRVPGLDDASVLKAVADFMDRGFEEDAAYLRRMR